MRFALAVLVGALRLVFILSVFAFIAGALDVGFLWATGVIQ